MVKRKEIRHRKWMRLKHYDYNRAGAYFITICIQNRECLLGEIHDGLLHLNEYGKIVEKVWTYLPQHFEAINLDTAVIMPNHFHCIIVLEEDMLAIAPRSDSTTREDLPFYEKKTKLGTVIAYFKYQTTKLINIQRDMVGVKVWQRNYYDHIIRNEKSLEILRQYIIDNPWRWNEDQLHPNNPSKW